MSSRHDGGGEGAPVEQSKALPPSEQVQYGNTSLVTPPGLLYSLNEDIMMGIISAKTGDSIETDSFLQDLNYKDKHPLMLFDEEMKHYYRSWKGVSNNRPTTELIILALNMSIVATYVIKFVMPSQPLRADMWPIYAVDFCVVLLNLLSMVAFKVLASSSPNVNCHNYVDMTKACSRVAIYSECQTWDQRLFTFLWYERHYWVAAKCGAELLSMLILLVEQTFANGTCTASDMKNVVQRLYWLDCNMEGVSQATSIFTAMRLLLHPFTYVVLARAEFEYIMTIHGLSLTFLTICNLLTPSLAFLHPTILYGIILGLGMLYFERNQRLLYLREVRFRHTERKLRDQTATLTGPLDHLFVSQRQGAPPFPASLSSMSQSE